MSLLKAHQSKFKHYSKLSSIALPLYHFHLKSPQYHHPHTPSQDPQNQTLQDNQKKILILN